MRSSQEDLDEAKEIHGTADCLGLSQARGERTDVLPLEEEVWRYGSGRAPAVDEFERLLERSDENRAINNGERAVKAYYHLGVAYEQSGWHDKAIEQYGEFLDIWKDADPGIEEVEDAIRRLAALKEM
jgi:tetratricopeptide (TPR) repeat protein